VPQRDCAAGEWTSVRQVLLRRRQIDVAHPFHDLSGVGVPDRVRAEGVPQVVKAKLAKLRFRE
jgi:hypothetical protein